MLCKPTTEDLVALVQRRCVAGNEVRRGVCLLNAGSFDEAARCFARAARHDSTDRSLPAYLAAAWMGAGRPAAAARQLGRAIGSVRTRTVDRIRHALALRAAGRVDDADEALRRAVQHDPESAELHFQLGTLLADRESFDEAELRFTQALNLDRDHAAAMVSLAMCLATRGALVDSLAQLRRAQVRRPYDAQIGLLLAQAAKAVQQQGMTVRLHAAIEGDVAGDAHGIEELSRVIEADPDFVDAFLSIPVGRVDETLFAMLLKTVESALERQPEHAELHYHCGRVLARLGRKDEAIDSNERAVELDPRFVQALIELGRLYHQTDRTADATTRLEQAIAAGAEYADVYFLLGNLYRDQGELGRARSAYRQALCLNGEYRAAHQALAALAP